MSPRPMIPLLRVTLVTSLTALLLATGCADPPPRAAPASSTSPGTAAERPPTSTSAPVEAPPSRWSTTQRDPETAKVFAAARGPMEMLAACSVASDDGDEGEVFLERAGSVVHGTWGDTVVTGRVGDDGGVELVDAGTKAVVFRGEARGGQLTGTLRAEGEERAVRSLPALALDRGTTKLGPSGGRRVVEVTIVDGKVASAKTTDWNRLDDRDVATQVDVEGPGLRVTDERGTYRLHATAKGVVGRAPTGDLVVLSAEEPRAGVAFPVVAGGLTIASRHAKQGREGTACAIDLQLLTVKGTPRDTELGKELERRAVEAAAGVWGDDEPPTSASLRCRVDAMNDAIIRSASFTATPLAGRLVNLEISGYARTSSMSPAVTTNRCLVLDGEAGVLVDVLAGLPPDVEEILRAHADRGFARQLRSRQLTVDDAFVADRLESLASASVCATPGGVRVLVPSGVITRHMASPPYAFDVPKARVAPRLPAGHVLVRAWSAGGGG